MPRLELSSEYIEISYIGSVINIIGRIIISLSTSLMCTSRCFTDDFHNQKFSNADHDYISGQKRQIVLDQIRIVDKSRLIKKPGSVSGSAEEKILNVLQEMFAP